MKPDEALNNVNKRFPFAGYIDTTKQSYLTIANIVLRYLQPSSKILDFGCGPCDITAVLQELGYRCSGCDDLQDDWHKIGENKQKILEFVRECGIDFKLAGRGRLEYQPESFDMVIMTDILEHLHDSPKDLLNRLLTFLRPQGYLLITVPNAVNIRKRVNVLRGKTNLPAYKSYYWYPSPWRGHVREYTKGDLQQLTKFLGLKQVELFSFHTNTRKIPWYLRPIYYVLTAIFTGWRESWLVLAQKPNDWVLKRDLPTEDLKALLGDIIPYKD